MSTQPDFSWSLNNGDPDANQQDVSPESFERHIEDSEIELDWPLHQFQDHFTYLRETLPVTTPPSSLTYSTMSESELAASQHSYAFAPSEYSIPSEIATRGPEEHGVYVARDYRDMSSAIVPNDPSSFGPLPPSPPSHLVRAHSNYRTSDPYQSFFDISPEEPSLDMQQSSTIIGTPLHPVQGMSDGQTQVAPAREYQCHLCSHSSKRKSNLRVHILTHDKEQSKRFECPTCGNRFTRNHDLKRHRRDQHGDLGPSSSDPGSAVASGSATGVPETNLACFWQV